MTILAVQKKDRALCKNVIFFCQLQPRAYTVMYAMLMTSIEFVRVSAHQWRREDVFHKKELSFNV